MVIREEKVLSISEEVKKYRIEVNKELSSLSRYVNYRLEDIEIGGVTWLQQYIEITGLINSAEFMRPLEYESQWLGYDKRLREDWISARDYEVEYSLKILRIIKGYGIISYGHVDEIRELKEEIRKEMIEFSEQDINNLISRSYAILQERKVKEVFSIRKLVHTMYELRDWSGNKVRKIVEIDTYTHSREERRDICEEILNLETYNNIVI